MTVVSRLVFWVSAQDAVLIGAAHAAVRATSCPVGKTASSTVGTSRALQHAACVVEVLVDHDNGDCSFSKTKTARRSLTGLIMHLLVSKVGAILGARFADQLRTPANASCQLCGSTAQFERNWWMFFPGRKAAIAWPTSTVGVAIAWQAAENTARWRPGRRM